MHEAGSTPQQPVARSVQCVGWVRMRVRKGWSLGNRDLAHRSGWPASSPTMTKERLEGREEVLSGQKYQKPCIYIYTYTYVYIETALR